MGVGLRLVGLVMGQRHDIGRSTLTSTCAFGDMLLSYIIILHQKEKYKKDINENNLINNIFFV